MKTLFIALLIGGLLVAGCVSQPPGGPGATAGPTAIATAIATPTIEPEPTAVPTATPAPEFSDITPVPEFTKMTFNEFLKDCSKPASLTGALKGEQVRIDFKDSKVYGILNRNGVVITLDGFSTAPKPSGMDATGSTLYTFYGRPARHAASAYSQNDCWLNVEKIETTVQDYPFPE